MLFAYLSRAHAEGSLPSQKEYEPPNGKGRVVVVVSGQTGPDNYAYYAKDFAEKGYYDDVIFHRVIKGFMIQGGDPTGTGRGGESAWGGRFNDEIDAASAVYQRGYKKGTVAMANAGPNTNGSQFFIMHADYPLPSSYTIFGRVIDGLDVVDAIATSQTDRNDKPTSEVKMERVTIEE